MNILVSKRAKRNITFLVSMYLKDETQCLIPRGQLFLNARNSSSSSLLFLLGCLRNRRSMRATEVLVAEYRCKRNFFFSHFIFLFFPSLPPAADCYASNLCSRFGMFLFLSLWSFFPVSISFFLLVVVVLCVW